MPRSVLALFARVPEPGQVKTRLCPPLRPDQAADLYRAMLLDTLDQHADANAGPEDLARAVWYTPADGRDWFRRHVPAGYRLFAQRGPDLARRMTEAFAAHADEGFERIVLRGTDGPTLPRAYVDQALTLLDSADLVLAPDLDGGYGLIGLRGPVARDARALLGVELGHAGVLAQTLAAAGRAALRTRLLAPHYDVDTAPDVARLRRELAAAPGAAPVAPRTWNWLRANPGVEHAD